MIGSDEIKAQVVKAESWRNRIIGHGEEDAEQLLANPANWRVHPKHQQDALSGVLSEVGWVQNVIVNQRTGHVIDGHLRVSLAISRGEKVPVLYVDLAPEEESLILATIDPLSALAVADNEQLDALLRDVSTGDAAVQEMLAELAVDAERTTLGDVEEGNERHLGDKLHQVTAVLYMEQIDVFEAALRATGNVNRAEAMMEICKVYLADHEEG